MVSSEFRATISEKNLLRARIMLKDSFVIDPTFIQLDEMLFYAKTNLPNLFVPFDGESLEDDATKWNEAVMNEELVQLVTNFSEIRVRHLKKVVAKVLESEAAKIRSKRTEQAGQQNCPKKSNEPPVRGGTSSSTKKFDQKTLEKKVIKIYDIMTRAKSQGSWKSTDIDKMEQAVKAILREIKNYKSNK